MEAWHIHHRVDGDAPFFVSELPAALFDPKNAAALAERKRGDFFRDALDAIGECPPSHLDYPCKGLKGEPCPLLTDDGYTDYAACWDEEERRQR